ncbi:DUF2065 domain-containing protein [Luteimonas sp. JM171]|uniref:DUF2065 domain-containing protein n=1 Tax=Luteimonas sp. JM171 TaxID=1896164 RepID=UPI000858F1EF|nr:DUF2065 family protein [Luteimonas sp. JM171]AOH36388.1 hypothetical protein BGP89_08500 [Luteimonas sp. JM171]
MSDLWAALCLVAVIEGLLLFVAPGSWKRAAAQLMMLPERQIRVIGGVVLGIGLVALYLVRNAGS